MFQLIFRGECQPGTDVATARSNARALFKASVEQVERMFSGRPVVIRNRLEQDQAEKYRLVLARHGMIAYVETMTGPGVTPDQSARPEAAPAPAARAASESRSAPDVTSADKVSRQGPAVEPGDRLPVAGDRVDEVLARSSLGLEPVGSRLEPERQVEEPVFDHLDDWSIAPPGTDLGVERDLPPPVVPDVSHLSLVKEEPGSGSRRS
ncbi:hypothetical protein SAMN05216203_3319 [Marinobacter daqiaonensis]|uniref:Uncharacterized protein n=1 Tax=Marinobacter daqiaonensis TaxID=650891 RepID=A0A1I6JUC3_9GAMM|nr:hypothetical protein [Marinobacter daqiaonensis]SFR82605.1 hypothetical protein SAMN05216203_3319 [Marinobacter daqiaonensis]